MPIKINKIVEWNEKKNHNYLLNSFYNLPDSHHFDPLIIVNITQYVNNYPVSEF